MTRTLVAMFLFPEGRKRLHSRVEVLRLRRRGLAISLDVGLDIDMDTQVSFGADCQIKRGALLSLAQGTLSMGDHVLFGEYTNVRAYESFIRIGSRVQLAQFVSLIAANHAVSSEGVPQWEAHDTRPGKHGIVIGDDCWLGAQATLLPGVTLGDRCIVAAGAVVTRGNYPAGSALRGVPAAAGSHHVGKSFV